MKNLELKAKLIFDKSKISPESDDVILSKIVYTDKLIQRDTYYSTATGRLKIREETNIMNKTRAYAILYERPDTKEDKYSDYIFYQIDNIELFLKVFGGALKREVVVNKTRELYMYENARIHFDNVDNLGSFVEIEVVIDFNGNEQRDPHIIMKELVKVLDIKDEDRITCGYRELIINK